MATAVQQPSAQEGTGKTKTDRDLAERQHEARIAAGVDPKTGAGNPITHPRGKVTVAPAPEKEVDATATATTEKKGRARAARQPAADKPTGEAKADHKQPREGSAVWAALEVLKHARQPLTPQEIYDKISEKKLAPGLKGKTPVATLAAQLAVHTKAGRFFERPEPGKYQLAKKG